MMNIFIQARMSSSRFPGKMLAPLHGKPLINHILEQVSKVPDIENLVVLTSVEPSDDPLAFYLEKEGHQVFRGSLENVFLRFQQALEQYPCDFFARISGDSPLISPDLITYMTRLAQEEECDFLSNVRHKKFPKGQSIEIIKSGLFSQIDESALTPDQREHVMPYFYDHADEYKCCFPDNASNQRHINTCVDTPEDLKKIEAGEVSYHFDTDCIC